MAVGNINELPESILLELFTHIPARQLLLRCRPVCSLWRDLIDLVTLWKRKCLREGFITEDWDQPVADWKIFYFLRSLHRNLLHNPCAEEGFEFWSLDVNGGDEWKVEDLSGDQRKEFPNDQVKKYFVTSYYTCLKSQVVDLKAEGYWEELMDTTRPDIEIKDWFAARPDCGSKYQLCVQLLSSAHAPLGTFQPDPATIQQKSDAKWREVCGQTTAGPGPSTDPLIRGQRLAQQPSGGPAARLGWWCACVSRRPPNTLTCGASQHCSLVSDSAKSFPDIS
uniref:F-box protein 44 n=1 Tax=Canis lupus dingo TaxID=286419 RepID=A0A8C0QXN6_CANLU